ncbi:conserved hypothetical protein [Gammaproteobacteria bacterium]
MKFFFPVIILSCFVSIGYTPVYAEGKIVVVINSKNDINSLTRDEVINIFLGRYRQFPSGMIAQPIDQEDQNKKSLFYKKLVGKELSEINSYWARLVFSGKTRPPRQARDIDELLVLVNTLPGAVAYVEMDEINANVKVAFTLY